MTKKLEELIGITPTKKKSPAMSQKAKEAAERTAKREEILANAPADNLFRSMADFDKIASALPYVKGLGKKSDDELDELAARATSAYDDLMDLGMNVEARYSSRIFEVASSMLKNAIDAKSSKIGNKLKMIELQLKKQKIDQDLQPKEVPIAGEGILVTDRNSLLERLKNMQ
jgi:hypothetical protein